MLEIASRLEAIASRLEASASRLEAIAPSLKAIASRLEAIIATKSRGTKVPMLKRPGRPCFGLFRARRQTPTLPCRRLGCKHRQEKQQLYMVPMSSYVDLC